MKDETMQRNLDTICKKIDELMHAKPLVLVALEGPCAAGKTTLAEELKGRYDCGLVHMDDFYLRPEQRTPQRLAEIGGNIDYERFQAQVLSPLLAGESFSYRPYDCGTRSLGAPVTVDRRRLFIIEGVYSMHPRLASAYDLSVFLQIDPSVQRQRILRRNSGEIQRRFFEEWIPMERRYFLETRVMERCDMIL